MVEIICKSVKRVIQYFCFPNRPVKGGDILNFEKGGNLRKGVGVRYDPPSLTNYDQFIGR